MKVFYLTFIASLFIVKLSFAQNNFDITNFGAQGDGKTINTQAIQKAIDACHAKGGGTVYFPVGVFMSATIKLKSNVTLELSRQAILKGSGNLLDYPENQVKAVSRVNNVLKCTKRAFIIGEDLQNIAIIGDGKIDASGNHPNFKFDHGEIPEQIFGCWLINCTNVALRDVRIENTSYWNVRLLFCDYVQVRGIRIFNHGNFNSDGIDIDGCHQVTISDCIVDASDDAICLKSEGDRASENVVITNCIVSSHASAIKLGTGSIRGFKNIMVSNCVIKPSKSKEMKHTYGAWGGLVGIDLDQVDGGTMDNISFNNITIDSVETPIFVKLGERNHSANVSGWSAKRGVMRNISFSHIFIKNGGLIASNITGYPGNAIENISLDHITIHTTGGGSDRDTILYVPEESKNYPVNRMFGSNLPAYGLYVKHVKNLNITNVSIIAGTGDVRSAIVLDDVISANLCDVKAENSSSLCLPDIRIVRCKDIDLKVRVAEAMKENYLGVADTSSQIYLNGQLMKYKAANNHSVTNKNLAKRLPPLDSALVAYWNFDEGTGNILKDISKNGLDGKITQAAWTKGKSGKALKFNNKSFVDMGQNALLNVQSSMTFSFWMKLDKPDANAYYRVFCKREAWDTPLGFELEIKPDGNRFNLCGGNKNAIEQGNLLIKFDTLWHQYTGVLFDSRLRLYLDGKLYAADDRVASPTKAEGVPFVIGANSRFKDNLEGTLDEFRIWNRALNAEEIKNLYK